MRWALHVRHLLYISEQQHFDASKAEAEVRHFCLQHIKNEIGNCQHFLGIRILFPETPRKRDTRLKVKFWKLFIGPQFVAGTSRYSPFISTQRAMGDILMSRDKFWTRNFPQSKYLLKCLPKCLSPTRDSLF